MVQQTRRFRKRGTKERREGIWLNVSRLTMLKSRDGGDGECVWW